MPKKIIESSVESTSLGPLWARANYSALYPEILTDPQAELVLKKVYDLFFKSFKEEFALMEQFMDEFASLIFLFRAKQFDDEIRDFAKDYPNATIINLGCGIDNA